MLVVDCPRALSFPIGATAYRLESADIGEFPTAFTILLQTAFSLDPNSAEQQGGLLAGDCPISRSSLVQPARICRCRLDYGKNSNSASPGSNRIDTASRVLRIRARVAPDRGRLRF